MQPFEIRLIVICLMSHLPLFLTNFVKFVNLWFLNVDFFVVFCMYIFCKIPLIYLICFLKWLVTASLMLRMNELENKINNKWERASESFRKQYCRGNLWIPWAEAALTCSGCPCPNSPGCETLWSRVTGALQYAGDIRFWHTYAYSYKQVQFFLSNDLCVST